MDTLFLKIVTTPALIAFASLVGRRWGSAVSGWLIGIPFTSAPIVFFLALDQGASFASSSSVAVLAGSLSGISFALTYAGLALKLKQMWAVCLFGGYLAVLGATVLLQFLTISVLPLFLIVIAILLLSIRIMPQTKSSEDNANYPKWDLPARMIAATVFVIVVTGVAPILGSHLSGLVAPFPIYASILAVFNQRSSGVPSVVKLLRGLLYGLFSFATFFLTLSIALQGSNVGLAFASALCAALIVQGLALVILRRREKTKVTTNPNIHTEGPNGSSSV
jgi:hypothetical protein